MPLYQVRCQDCTHEDSIWRKVDDRDKNLPRCPACILPMHRIVSAPMVIADLEPFISPSTGKVINSRVALRNDLEMSGHILNEPGLKQDIARNKEYQADKTYAPVAAAVDETVRQLVNAGKIES